MNAENLFRTMVTKFGLLYNRVKKTHEAITAQGNPAMGHGWDHDLMVAQYGAIIAEDARVAEMVWVVALMHSTDRHGDHSWCEGMITEYFSLLPPAEFSPNELAMMHEALADHSKLNDPNDNPVTVALKDADRLANVGAINLIRGGQHRANIPACIPETLGGLHPQSSFKYPMSCYDATFYNLEWQAMLRLSKARELGEKYFAFLRHFQDMAVVQQREVGLHPWPL